MRQTTCEIVKAYAAGATGKELDEVFTLLIWLQGASYFVSEIFTSAAFRTYELIKKLEGQGKGRNEILSTLAEWKSGCAKPSLGTRIRM
jgi:hypothetical protein